MKVLEAIYGRRAIRDYTAEPVSPAVLRELIDAAAQAPSAMNERPWRFTVVTDKGLLSRISKEAKAFASKTGGDRIRQMLTDPGFDIFYDAPVLIVISAPKHSRWAIEDCALAAENLMVAAYAASLGTCWIGFAEGWLNTKEGLSALNLAPEQRVVAPIILGHPKTAPAPHLRPAAEINWIA